MFTERQVRILEILLNNVSGVTGRKLSESLGVSVRTIRNEIAEINHEWKNGGLIEASRQKGYFIKSSRMDHVRKYFFTKGSERAEETAGARGFLILGIVLEKGHTDIFDLGEKLGLSESMVYKEVLRFQKKLFSEYQCENLLMNGDRLRVEADERALRHMLFRIIKNETQSEIGRYYSLMKMLLYHAFDLMEYKWMLRLVKEYFDSRSVQISDANLYMIVSAVYISLIRNNQGYRVRELPGERRADQETWEFFKYLQKQSFALSEGDCQILGELLYNFKLTPNPAKGTAINSLSTLVLEDFCHDVMEKYHFDLWQSRHFYDNILIHIEYMMRRLETGYGVRNPILNDIKIQYPYAYEISMLMVPVIYRYKNCYIQDDEISYIAIFVEHFLENVNQKLKVVIISSSRYSISSIVSRWIETNFQNQLQVDAMIPQHNLEIYLSAHSIDLIISTGDAVVHPTIATYKIEGIPDHYTMRAMNALIYRIRMNYQFREAVKAHFNSKTIRIYREEKEFDQVIRELSEALLAEGYLYDLEEFVDDVLSREINYPTSVADWFMIPHPLVTFARKNGVGAAVLKKPVKMKDKEIQLIFLLAIEKTQTEQDGILFQFFRQIALEQSARKQLTAVETEEELLDALVQISNCVEFW